MIGTPTSIEDIERDFWIVNVDKIHGLPQPFKSQPNACAQHPGVNLTKSASRNPDQVREGRWCAKNKLHLAMAGSQHGVNSGEKRYHPP